jgi:hypothetical protein
MKSFLTGMLNIAGNSNPLIGAATGIINSFLPSEKKLSAASTGQELLNAYNQLPSDYRQQIDQRAQLELANIHASVDKLEAMVSVENAGSNTRPFIALMMAWVVAIAILAMMGLWGKAVWYDQQESLQVLSGSWELMLVLLATPTALLRAYFGMRTNEKKARYAAAMGQPVPTGIVAGLTGLLKK